MPLQVVTNWEMAMKDRDKGAAPEEFVCAQLDASIAPNRWKNEPGGLSHPGWHGHDGFVRFSRIQPARRICAFGSGGSYADAGAASRDAASRGLLEQPGIPRDC